MIHVDLKSRKAIYEQIIDNFKQLIVAGIVTCDTQVPPVRDMAKSLTVNPNTVQKAYRELEKRGYLYTVPGQGSFVASVAMPNKMNKDAISGLYHSLQNTVTELLFRGESMDDLLQFVQYIKKEAQHD